MLPTYKAILTANQIRWLETPPAWLPDQPLMIHITFLQEPPVVMPAVAEDPLLQLAGSIQSEVTDIGIRGSDAMWVITEALANCQVRPNLRGLKDLGGFWLSPRLHHYQILESDAR